MHISIKTSSAVELVSASDGINTLTRLFFLRES